jgi:hypothetical protein
MKSLILALFGLALSSMVMAESMEDAQSKALSEAMEKTYQSIIDSYEPTCREWGQQNGLTGDALDKFISECNKEMPNIRPVGSDDSE